jgi:hypothetical protein
MRRDDSLRVARAAAHNTNQDLNRRCWSNSALPLSSAEEQSR